jgi:small subunit ribosomal protein S16
MVKIRLRRTGAKKQPHYRVVVADSRSPRDGKFIETIGHYNPRTEPPTVEIDAERALYWLGVGAQPSEAVRRMLDKMGIMAQAAAVRKGEVSVGEVLTQLEPSEEARLLEEAAIEEEISDIEEEVLEAEAYLFDEEVETALETEEELFEGEDEEEDEEEDWEEDAEEEEDFEEEDEFFEDEDEDEDWDEDEDEDEDDDDEEESE